MAETMNEENKEKEDKRVVLEKQKRLSESLIWGFQRAAFEEQGIENWRQGTVPHYVTSNPFIAAAYAKLVFAYFRDCYQASQENHPFDLSQPFYIVELGAGAGRFAYYFLKKFQQLHADSRLKQFPFKYVMTDFTTVNITYWRNHSHLQPLIEAGLLDFASFDIERDTELVLHLSQQRLTPENARNPLVILANYVFDSVPQDLFGIVNGQLYERLSTIHSKQPEPNLTDLDMISRIDISYDNQLVTGGPYEDDLFNRILAEYQERLANTDILFPILALRCLNRWRELAGGRFLLISGDKGYSREEDLSFLEEPYIATHGRAFSMMVNFHAIGQYFLHQGGTAFHPAHRHTSLNISAFALGFSTEEITETRSAYADVIDAISPDDFFLLVTTLRENNEVLKPETALALLRLSQWDAEVLLRNLPAFLERVETASELFLEEIYWAVCQVWANYYPIGEEWDLAFYLGMLLYRMRYYNSALEYLGHSLHLYGENATTFHNMALCYFGLHQMDKSMEYVDKALALDPTFDSAKGLRVKLQAEMKRHSR